jgi:putative acetyltransferase
MTASAPTVRVVDVEGEQGLGHARRLFRAYAGDVSGTIAAILRVQGFDAEVAGLPGRYAPPSGCLLLAMDGEAPAGCVALRDLGGGTCEMKRLYVAPGCRGRGVGGLLVGEVLRRGERAGYRRMVLDSMPEMAEAIALYRRHGFVETDPYWGHPTGHAIFMERSLRGEVRMGHEPLAESIQSDMAAYVEHLAARIERLVGLLSVEELWAKPFAFGNSVGRIVVHLTGSLNHYVGAKVAGTGYERDRPAEFSGPSRPTADALLRDFRETIGMLVRTLRSQGEEGLMTPVTGCGDPVRDRFGLFLVCTAHVSNHVGQIVYLVQALGHPLDEKVW